MPLFRHLFILFLLSYIGLFASIAPVVDKFESGIDALILKDLSNQKVLYSKEPQKRVRPASLTKIMTAILAIESGKMNKLVTITKEATTVEPSKAGLKIGEKFYLRDLVKSTLIQSANDSATAIGIFVGGNTQKFIEMMNKKAKAIGMTQTNFTNAAGFDIGEHSSSAHDLLKLAEYAIKNPTFNKIVKMERHTFTPVNKSSKKYVAHTHNKLLKNHKYTIGIKTGYTSKAGPCLIARAKNGKKDVLLVMLNSREDRWKSAQQIFDETMKGAVAKHNKK